jgi:hypothetical protein
MRAWLSEHQTLLWWVGALSAIVGVASVLAAPWFIARLPEDYLSRDDQEDVVLPNSPPLVRWPLLLLKNALGAVLVLSGVAMLILPGQGVLTMAAGLMLLDFPGRRRALRWIMGRKRILRGINWIRRKAKRAPLQAPAS